MVAGDSGFVGRRGCSRPSCFAFATWLLQPARFFAKLLSTAKGFHSRTAFAWSSRIDFRSGCASSVASGVHASAGVPPHADWISPTGTLRAARSSRPKKNATPENPTEFEYSHEVQRPVMTVSSESDFTIGAL